MSLRILIVDDSAAMRTFIRRTLEFSGLPVDSCATAANGLEALTLLKQQQIDLILSDINMPQMDGAHLLAAIEQDEALRGIPVLMVSTDSTQMRVSAMLSLGARGYVKKPFSPEVLREEIERVLAVQQ